MSSTSVLVMVGDAVYTLRTKKVSVWYIERRLRVLEERIERLEREKLSKGNHYIHKGENNITSGRSLAAGQGLPEPLTRVQIPAAAFLCFSHRPSSISILIISSINFMSWLLVLYPLCFLFSSFLFLFSHFNSRW